MKNPKISVIIPVYNVENYLIQCLDSVINQTLKEIEIICVDDHSTDHSLDILNDYSKSDARIRVIAYDTNKSASQARKDGVLMSCGKYILFLDADDTYETYAFEELYAEMEKRDVDVLHFGTYVDAEPGVSKQGVDWFKKFAAPLQKRLDGKEVFENCFVNQAYSFNLWNKIYRSELCKKAFSCVEDGFFPKAQDLYAFFIISWFAQSYCGIKKQYYHYAYGRGITGGNKQISVSGFSRICSQFRVAQKCKEFLENQDAWEEYENAWGVLYTNLLNECCNIWFKKVKAEMSAEAFDILVEAFGSADVNEALKKMLNGKQEEIALKTMGASSLAKSNMWFFPIYDVTDPQDAVVPDGFETVVPVVFATNDKYAPYASVAIQSVIEHMTQQNYYRVYVFHTGIEKRYIELLNGLSNEQMCVQCINVTPEIDSRCSKLYETAYFTKEMYYRFIIPEVLPFYDKVIYLDCDLIVEKDIAGIIPVNMEDQYIAGVKNPIRKKNISFIERYLGVSTQNYINSGVLVFNVRKCIEDGITDKCFELVPIAAKKRFLCPDQDILNNVCYGHIMILPYKWNYMWQFVVEGTLEHLEAFRDAFYEVGDNFSVLHFTSAVKPWSHPQHPLAKYFWHYARKSCFYEEILQSNLLNGANCEGGISSQSKLESRERIADPTTTSNKIARLERELAEARKEIQNIHSSWSYRIGRFITWLPRKVRGGIRCYQEHGVAYTMQRVLVHLHLVREYEEQRHEKNVHMLKLSQSAPSEPVLVKKDYKYYSNLLPEKYEEELKLWYENTTGEELNLEAPKTFNEKIQWLKLFDSTPLKTKLADKYLVREWVKEKLGEEYLIPMVGVWDSFDEIDFDKMPDQFALKANHGSGWNLIVKDKTQFDKNTAKKKFDIWMGKNFAFAYGLELHYMNIPPRIIAEEYHPCQYEYQFWCFNGKPVFISAIHEPHGQNAKATYDPDWNEMDFVTSLPKLEGTLPRPVMLEEMTRIANIIAAEFAFVRVDFLYDEKNLFVGEITFTPAGGLCKWTPKEYDRILGDKLSLPPKSVAPERMLEV